MRLINPQTKFEAVSAKDIEGVGSSNKVSTQTPIGDFDIYGK